LAVGIVLVGQLMLVETGNDATRTLVQQQSLAALAFFVAGTLASFFHTGSPRNSPFTLLNIGSSWLSREIAMNCLTGLALLWLAVLGRGKSAQEEFAAIVAIVVGILFIFVTSRVYNQKYMPSWNNLGVLPAFLASMLLLGTLWHGLVLAYAGLPVPLASPTLAAVIGLTLMAVSLPLAAPDQSLVVNERVMAVPYSCQSRARGLHALLSGAGVCLFLWAVLCAPTGYLNATLVCLAFALLAVGEIFGRLVFYWSYTRLGV